MHRIITLSRQFGSGGRELGKRLAEELGYAYCDAEIVEAIVKNSGLARSYVESILEKPPVLRYYPITVGRSIHSAAGQTDLEQRHRVFAELSDVIREMAEGSDAVFVGRCADYILRDQKPFRIFCYADLAARVARCKMKAPESEMLTEKELEKSILKIDKGRARYYEHYTGQKWGSIENYDLCINTSGIPIKHIAKALALLLEEEQGFLSPISKDPR